MEFNSAITAVISTSPLWCNPNTEIVDETYGQLRKHLPTAQVILVMDGVHPEQPHLAERYELFKEAIREKPWENFQIVECETWQHQSGTLQELVRQKLIQTPLTFWMEHDLPLRDDCPIEWQGIVDTMLSGKLDGLRFNYVRERTTSAERGFAHPQGGIPFVRTIQFVGWPAIFRTEVFEEFVNSFESSKCYLEGSEYEGFFGNNYHRFVYGFYCPGDDPRRVYHTNGRCRGTQGERSKPYIETPRGKRYPYGFPYRP